MIVSGTKGQKAESAEEDQAAAKKEEATGGGEGREGESLRRGELESCCIAYSRPMRDGPDSGSGRRREEDRVVAVVTVQSLLILTDRFAR